MRKGGEFKLLISHIFIASFVTHFRWTHLNLSYCGCFCVAIRSFTITFTNTWNQQSITNNSWLIVTPESEIKKSIKFTCDSCSPTADVLRCPQSRVSSHHTKESRVRFTCLWVNTHTHTLVIGLCWRTCLANSRRVQALDRCWATGGCQNDGTLTTDSLRVLTICRGQGSLRRKWPHT